MSSNDLRGIEERHARSCRSRSGGHCNCTPTYQAQVYDKTRGRQIRRTFPTLAAGRSWRKDAQMELRATSSSNGRGPTLNAALDTWLESLERGTEQTRSGDPFKPGTVRLYRRNLEAFGVRESLGHLRVREVATADVQRWIDGLVRRDKLASATLDNAVTPLKAFYRRATVRGLASINPCTGVMKPAVRCRERRVVGPKQAAQMLEVLNGRDRTLWAVAFYTGLRRGELIGLRRADVDIDNGVIHVRRGWDMVVGEIEPKSRNSRRRVPIPAVLRAQLAELDADPLLGAPRWIAHTGARVRPIWEAAGLPAIDLHEARHTYASMMIAAGVNAKTLSAYLGHANIAITLDLYGHLLPGNEDQAAALFNGYLSRETGAPIGIAV